MEGHAGGNAGRRQSAPWWQKVMRVFFFTFVSTFLTTGVLPIAEKLEKGEDVDFTVAKALLLSAITAAIGAAIRAAVAALPIFADDNDIGMKKGA